MSDLAVVLADLADVFADRPWYLFGAHAVIAWAVPRQTSDVDITVIADVADVVSLGIGCWLGRSCLASRWNGSASSSRPR